MERELSDEEVTAIGFALLLATGHVAIKADYALPPGQGHSRELNARLALVWPMAQSRKPLADADHWATVSNKWAWLETGSQG